MLDSLKHIDDAKREQDKALGPSPEQVALAELLDSLGRWDLFLTNSFRPNKHECIVQSKDDKFYRNEKVQWCGGPKVVKRKTRNGGLIYGSPAVAPGWSKHQAIKQGVKFMRRNFRSSRWVVFAEGSSKGRDCAHLHGLVANAPNYNPEIIAGRWLKDHGRCDIEAIKHNLGLAHYLAKGYVCKDYGKKDNVEFEFSKNCRFALDDKTPEWYYHLRQVCFRGIRKGEEQWTETANALKKQMLHEVKRLKTTTISGAR